MSNLRFVQVGSEDRIYDPLAFTTGSEDFAEDVKVQVIEVTNVGDATVSGLGMYIKPATNLGEMTKYSTKGPHTDFQTVLTSGTFAQYLMDDGGVFEDDFYGLFISASTAEPDGEPDVVEGIVTRSYGASVATKIPLPDLTTTATLTLTLAWRLRNPFELGAAGRLFVDLVVE